MPDPAAPADESALIRWLAGQAAPTPDEAVRHVIGWLSHHPEVADARWAPTGEDGPPATPVPPSDGDRLPGGRARARGRRSRVVVDVVDGTVPRGALTVAPRGGDADRCHHLAGAAADVLVLALRDADLRAAATESAGTPRRARAELQELRATLASVQAAERRRLVTAVLDATRRPAGDLVASADELTRAAASGAPVEAVLVGVERACSVLLRRLRRLARGTDVAVLRAQGPVQALAEVSQDLDHCVRSEGDLTVRSGWEIEAGLFWAVVAVLQQLDRWPGAGTLRARWARAADRLSAELAAVSAHAPGGHAAEGPAPELDLAAEAQRLRALGGGLSVSGHPPTATVTLWLPLTLGSGRTADDGEATGDRSVAGAAADAASTP